MQNVPNTGIIFILSAPSGGGKTSVAKTLVRNLSNLKLSISATTRNPRIGEMEGVDYFFISLERFNLLIEDNGLLEYTQIYNNYYGTPKDYIYDNLNKGTDIIFDIDWHGANTIKEKINSKVITIFLLPPNIDVLKERLKARGQDTEENINYRISNIENELKYSDKYDYKLINDNFEETVNKVNAIINSERNK